jgi:hypothetical protein
MGNSLGRSRKILVLRGEEFTAGPLNMMLLTRFVFFQFRTNAHGSTTGTNRKNGANTKPVTSKPNRPVAGQAAKSRKKRGFSVLEFDGLD